MADVNVDILARSLVQLLGQMVELEGELGVLMREKLEAIKRADSDLMQSITARETQVAARLGEREGLRRQISERIVAGLGLDPATQQGIKLTELAEYLPEPRRSQLLVAAAGLRERLGEIERMRVTTTLITQEMLKHMREVFSVMTAGHGAVDGYSRTGQRQRAGSTNVFEAVG